MISLQRKPWHRVAWFVVGLLSTLLLAGLPSLWQPATAASRGNQVEIVQHFDKSAELVARINPAFEEVAASHLEPNFYQ